MAKIKYSVDAKGVLRASADVHAFGRMHRVTASGASLDRKGGEPYAAWAQITLDLFEQKEMVQNGASKPERGQ